MYGEIVDIVHTEHTWETKYLKPFKQAFKITFFTFFLSNRIEYTFKQKFNKSLLKLILYLHYVFTPRQLNQTAYVKITYLHLLHLVIIIFICVHFYLLISKFNLCGSLLNVYIQFVTFYKHVLAFTVSYYYIIKVKNSFSYIIQKTMHSVFLYKPLV